MRATSEELARQAMHLPEAEKLKLVDELLTQLEIPDAPVQKVWEEEVAARIEADKRSPLETLNYEEVMAKYR